jgi:hypothetical protein
MLIKRVLYIVLPVCFIGVTKSKQSIRNKIFAMWKKRDISSFVLSLSLSVSLSLSFTRWWSEVCQDAGHRMDVLCEADNASLPAHKTRQASCSFPKPRDTSSSVRRIMTIRAATLCLTGFVEQGFNLWNKEAQTALLKNPVRTAQ